MKTCNHAVRALGLVSQALCLCPRMDAPGLHLTKVVCHLSRWLFTCTHATGKGKNVAFLAYGPTGAGKTYTTQAVYTAALDQLFHLYQDHPCTINVQFIEVYQVRGPRDMNHMPV